MVYSLSPDQMLDTGTTPMLLIPVTPLTDRAATFTLSDLLVADHQARLLPVQLGNTTLVVGKSSAMPEAFSLQAARPNPFNPSTTIAYEVPQQAHITLTIYNLLGQKVAQLVDGLQAAGRYEATWNGLNDQHQTVASGVYVYRLTSSTGFSETKRMTLLK